MNYNSSSGTTIYYHTKKVLDSKVNGQIINETVMFTGYCKGEGLKIGDTLSLNKGDDFTINEVLEERNHAGIFNNPDDKINSFFKVKCDHQRLIEMK